MADESNRPLDARTFIVAMDSAIEAVDIRLRQIAAGSPVADVVTELTLVREGFQILKTQAPPPRAVAAARPTGHGPRRVRRRR